MTIGERLGLHQRTDTDAYDLSAYWARPSVRCRDCDREFSDVVGHLHAQRMGHTVEAMPEAKAAA